MLLLLAAAVTYSFAPGMTRYYQADVRFQGYLPILGGQQGVADVGMAFRVEGLSPDSTGLARAASELTDFKISFNGTPLPLTLSNALQYFPRTTISVSPNGKISKSDAPDISLPVKLPGLDVKRFPDSTYLPIVFPEGPLTVGKSWTYQKPFGDSQVSYVVTPTEVTEERVMLTLKLNQRFETTEDETKNVTTNQKDAFAAVTTEMSGSGTAEFDRRLGALRLMKIEAAAKSDVRELKSGSKSTRELKTTVRVTLRP